MSDQRDPNEITYELILREVRAGKDAVADAIKEFDARQIGIDKMMGIVVESMGRIENEMAAVRQQQFAIADGKTIAMQLRKDFDAHEANHRWNGSVQIGKAIGAAGATVGAVGWLGRNWDRIHAFVHRLMDFGKPPHS